MKLKFKVQPYQTNAVESVVDCLEGQPREGMLLYRIDPGRKGETLELDDGLRNADLRLSDAELLTNIQAVQKRQNLPVSKTLDEFTTFNRRGERQAAPRSYKPGARVNLDIEMETGTGKTYCYI